MKRFAIFCFLLFTTFTFAQSLEGSWKLVEENGKEISDKEIIRIYEDNYFAEGAKNSESDEFLWALGGEYSIENDDYTSTQDFNTK